MHGPRRSEKPPPARRPARDRAHYALRADPATARAPRPRAPRRAVNGVLRSSRGMIWTMSFVTADDGVRLYFEEQGDGEALLFIHEFAGDQRSWEPQIEHFRDRYRCIVYAARGYPPSDVPSELESYSQERAVDDALAVLDGLGVGRAHLVGLSMGGFCALHLGLRAPERTRSLLVAGVGYGAAPDAQERFRRE